MLSYNIRSNSCVVKSNKGGLKELRAKFKGEMEVIKVLSLSNFKINHNKKRRMFLVLDLDETLIHTSSSRHRDIRYDFMVEVIIGKSSCLCYIFARPYLNVFLQQVSKWFTTVIFTSSRREYADPIISRLDEGTRVIKKRYFRDSCIEKDGKYIKDLNVVNHSSLKNVILIDNNFLTNKEFNSNNLIPIPTWILDKNDKCLLNILPFLNALRYISDVRSVLSLRNLE